MMILTEVSALGSERRPVSWSKPIRDDAQAIAAEKFRDPVQSGMIPAVM
ncbi:hypothetical protein [Actinomadura rubrisoli]|nr:hypothetical protein [Actinomadura rubrisoli]